MFASILNLFTSDLAVDLGSASTLIYAKSKGILLNEPSIVALRSAHDSMLSEKTVTAIGADAKAFEGRAHGDLTVVKPIQEAEVTDIIVTGAMLNHFFKKVYKSNWFTPHPNVVLTYPANASEVQRRSLVETLISAGAKSVWLLPKPLAAALGAELPIDKKSGVMVVDIGSGTTEIGILAFGELIYGHTIRIGSNSFDQAILNYLRRNYQVMVGVQTAEQLKIDLCSAVPTKENPSHSLCGMSIIEGTPKTIQITKREIINAIQQPLQELAQGINHALQEVPKELASDIAKSGILLSGGGAQLSNIDRYLTESMSVPVMIGVEPTDLVVKGAGSTLENLRLSKRKKLFTH